MLAGVVGGQKPLYDIWGDTVNMASRLEYTGELGKIQVSAELNRNNVWKYKNYLKETTVLGYKEDGQLPRKQRHSVREERWNIFERERKYFNLLGISRTNVILRIITEATVDKKK